MHMKALVENNMLIWYLVLIPEMLFKKQVLKNVVEVKLQRIALRVLKAPIGNKDDDVIDGHSAVAKLVIFVCDSWEPNNPTESVYRRSCAE